MPRYSPCYGDCSAQGDMQIRLVRILGDSAGKNLSVRHFGFSKTALRAIYVECRTALHFSL